MFLILFYIKNFVKSNSYSYYSTFVPPARHTEISLRPQLGFVIAFTFCQPPKAAVAVPLAA